MSGVSSQVRDAVFLHGYNEPTLLLLHETDPTCPGYYCYRKDTCEHLHPRPHSNPHPEPHTHLISLFAGSVIDIKRMLQVCSLGFVDEYLSEAAALYLGCFWAAIGCISGFSGTEGGCSGAVPQSAALPYPGRSLMG